MMIRMGLTFFKPYIPPDEIIRKLNQLLFSCTSETKYMTGVHVRITPLGEMSSCNAGHPPVLVFPAKGDNIVELLQPGTALGMFKEEWVPYTVSTCQLQPGDKVFVYTDGMIEWEDKKENQFGLENIKQYLLKNKTLPVDTILPNLLKSIQDFSQGNPSADDITMLGFEFLGENVSQHEK